MKIFSLLLALAGLMIVVPRVSAQSFEFDLTDSPAIVEAGLDTYRTSGSTAALTVWLAKSAYTADGLAAKFAQLESTNGKMQRFEQIGTMSLSPSVRVGWYTICYAKGVAFAEFTTLQGKASWIVTNIRVSSDYRDILPHYQFPLK